MNMVMYKTKIRGIRFKLIGTLILLLIITALLIGLILNNAIKKILVDNYIQTSTEQIKTVNQTVSLFQNAVDENIKMLANDQLIRKADQTISTYMNNTDTSQKMTPSQNGGIEQEIYNKFKQYADRHPGTLYLEIGTEYGGYVQWPETTNSANYDPRKRPWYTVAIAGGEKISRTDPYKDSVTGILTVTTATPVKDASGKVIGVIAIDVASDKITDILNQIKIGKTGYCMMIHKSGLIMADPSNPKNNSKYLKDIGIKGIEKVLEKDNTQLKVTVNNEQYFVNSIKASNSDWIIASLITSKEMDDSAKAVRKKIIFASAITLIIGLFITLIASGRIANPIKQISAILNKISTGDFNVEIQQTLTRRADEVGILATSADMLVKDMRNIIWEVKSSSHKVEESARYFSDAAEETAKATDEIAGAIDNLAGRTVAQTEASKKITDMLGEISSKIENITAKIKGTQEISKETGDLSTKAAGQMQEMQSKKEESIQKADVFSNVISQINCSAHKAESFTTIIEEISSQTNLLALNASIEAARAGEAGKGFAVVAEEIRKLSEQTANATVDIKNLMNSIKRQSEDAVDIMKDVKTIIEALNGAITESENIFMSNSGAVEKLLNNIDVIAQDAIQLDISKTKILEANKEIMDSSEENSAVTQEVAATTEEEAATMRQIADFANQLEKASAKLSEDMNRFKV